MSEETRTQARLAYLASIGAVVKADPRDGNAFVDRFKLGDSVCIEDIFGGHAATISPEEWDSWEVIDVGR